MREQLFVMLKVFRVPKENPLVWQKSLTEAELQQVLRGRFYASKVPPRKAGSVNITNAAAERRQIEEGEPCPVCQEEMEGLDNLVFCAGQCGNNVHRECMTQWAKYKMNAGEKISCPYCRGEWINSSDLFKSNRQRSMERAHLGQLCGGCRICPIAGSLYKCVVCRSFSMCETCFQRGLHAHHAFVVKPTANSTDLLPAERQLSGAPITAVPALPASLIHDLQTRELSAADYELLRELDASHTEVWGPWLAHLRSSTAVANEAQLARGNNSSDGGCCTCLQAIERVRDARVLRCGCLLHEACFIPFLQQRKGKCTQHGGNALRINHSSLRHAASSSAASASGGSSSNSATGSQAQRAKTTPQVTPTLSLGVEGRHLGASAALSATGTSNSNSNSNSTSVAAPTATNHVPRSVGVSSRASGSRSVTGHRRSSAPERDIDISPLSPTGAAVLPLVAGNAKKTVRRPPPAGKLRRGRSMQPSLPMGQISTPIPDPTATVTAMQSVGSTIGGKISSNNTNVEYDFILPSTSLSTR